MYKIGKIETQGTFLTFGLGCWTWTTQKQWEQNIQTNDPCSILDQNRFGHKIEKHENSIHVQLLGLAVGLGQPKKLLKNDTL